MEELFGRSSGLALDARRIDYVLHEELDLLLGSSTDKVPDPRAESRALLITWLARFLPEVVSREVRTRLRACVTDARAREDFLASLWYRVLPIDAALYALERDTRDVGTIVANLDHGTSGLRDRAVRSFAFVADLHHFSDLELQERVAHNLEISQSHCEWIAVAALVARGEPEPKRAALRRWLRDYRLNPDEREVLVAIDETGFTASPYFASIFLDVAHYALFRLACAGSDVSNTERSGSVRQKLLPSLGEDATDEEYAERVLEVKSRGNAPKATGSASPRRQDLAEGLFSSQQGALIADQMRDFTATAWRRLREHPLADGYVKILPRPNDAEVG